MLHIMMGLLIQASLVFLILIGTTNSIFPKSIEETQETEPIYILNSFHMDPIGISPEIAQSVYPDHRDAFLWLQELAAQSGIKISAFVTGPYAEGCVRSNHYEDFLDFMPEGPHALGVHLHAHHKPFNRRKPPFMWIERSSDEDNPVVVKAIFEDQIAFVNSIYLFNGVDPTENMFFHGAHVYLDDMSELFGISDLGTVSYPNTFWVHGGDRGLYHPYRGPYSQVIRQSDPEQKEDFNAPYVHIPITSGIIGFDQLHGDEGTLYGTLPYIKRDFIMEMLEWREVERGAVGGSPRIWVFAWGGHPYQTTDESVGTDGLSVRDSWSAIVSWFNNKYIEKRTPQGSSIARWANFREVSERFLEWEKDNPRVSSIDINDDGTANRVLQPLYEALSDAKHAGELETEEDGFLGERFMEPDGKLLWLLWSDKGEREIEIRDEIPYSRRILSADGSIDTEKGTTLIIEEEPVIITENR